MTLEIGAGNTNDDFSLIDWASNIHFIKTETDPTGGTNYTIIGTSELLSVPYALQATNAENGITTAQATAITDNTAKVGYTETLVSANNDVSTNSAKTGITTDQANEIVANTAKDGITTGQSAAIETNTIKVGITAGQANEISVNTAKTGITADQANAISASTANGWAGSGSNVYRATGNVGIGTSSPDYKLDLRGSGNQVINVYSDGTGEAYARFSQNNNTTSGPLMYIGAFGTTPSTFHCGINSRYNFPIKFHQNNITRMTIANGGNVGIGTSSPVSALHVKTTTQFDGIFLDDESGLIAKIARGDASGDPYFKLYSSISGKGVSIHSNESSYFNGGNVGIGTDSPDKLLHISGDGGNSASIKIESTNSSGAGYMYLQRNTDGKSYVLNRSNQALILGANNNTSQLYLKENGNVGIGTDSPADILTIKGAAGKAISFQASNGTERVRLGITTGSERGFIGIHNGAGTKTIQLHGEGNFTWFNSGNVGIGTTSPAYKLDVAGDVHANGWLRTTGNHGWYNQTHGGGWNMTDPNWIRSYGNMAVYIAGSTNLAWSGYYFSRTTSGDGTHYFNGARSVGLEVAHGIVGDWIGAYSDERIKDVIGRSSSKDDLSDLLSVEVTDYKMKDKVQYGDKVTKKVIAQQLKTVFPQAVSLQTKVIPNIYKISEIKEGYIALKTDLKKGDRVKLIFEDNEQTDEELVDVLSADKIGFTIDNKKEGRVFVYGKEVDDFHVVDYDAVSMLNVSATQELYKLILNKQKTIEKQKIQISAQIEESKKVQSSFDERIKNLENLFN